MQIRIKILGERAPAECYQHAAPIQYTNTYTNTHTNTYTNTDANAYTNTDIKQIQIQMQILGAHRVPSTHCSNTIHKYIYRYTYKYTHKYMYKYLYKYR